MHPTQALFQDQTIPKFLPVCDHYAGSEKLMRKSMLLQNELGPVFDITFDCEDGAAIGNEKAHIALISELLNSKSNQFNRIGVRIHDFGSPFFKSDVLDLFEKSANKVAYLVIPKISCFQQLLEAINFINETADQLKFVSPSIHVLIETQTAILDIQKIAAHPQVECLSFGIMDYISSHFGAIPASAMHSPQQFSHPLVMRAKIEISAFCHLYGKVASHNVTTEFKDVSIVSEDAKRAYQECGFTRMWSIHPNQIKFIIEAMTPKFEDISDSIAILTAAKLNSWGPIEFKDRLHDRASFRYYWSILKKASLSGTKLPSEAMAFI